MREDQRSSDEPRQKAGQRPTSGYYRDEFGRVARFYDFGIRNTFRVVGGERMFRCGIVEAAQVRPGHQVLDVSCGTGTLVAMLADCAGPEGRVTGIDLSEEMIAVARGKHSAGNVEFIVANAEDIPFADNAFDRVTISLAIHEMNREGRRNTFGEMHRVLKPGGLAVVADMRPPDTAFTRLIARFMGLVETETLTDLWRIGLYREMGDAGFVNRRRRLAGHGFFEIVVAEK
ncbi:MAG: methyltransferase domain-containing protein [Thermoleophilia bacterium]|nr:methyltransferase domain-containing protein [Thermoleophilia bacterium]